MTLVIPDEICQATHLTKNELKQEVAIMLFQKYKLTLGQASNFADMGQIEFQHFLASRKVPVHYDIKDFQHDLDTLKEIGSM